MSIVEDKLKNKKTEIKRIDKKVEEEQITPTSNEKKNINDIIQTISTQYRGELSDNNTDKNELNERITATIKEEIKKLPIGYEQKLRMGCIVPWLRNVE